MPGMFGAGEQVARWLSDGGLCCVWHRGRAGLGSRRLVPGRAGQSRALGKAVDWFHPGPGGEILSPQKTLRLGQSAFAVLIYSSPGMPWARQPVCPSYCVYTFSRWESQPPHCRAPAWLWRSSTWCSTYVFRKGWISAWNM